jgi:hypothetical protein
MIGVPFCYHNQHNQNDIVISGLIIDTTAHSIRLKVIDVLRGVELRDTITIWDGTDFDCNGLVSMKSTGLGHPGSSIITIIPRIHTAENNWDVIGDYRRPEHLCTASTVYLRNDTVYGFINGSIYSHDPMNEWTMETNYPDFKAEFNLNSGSCSLLSIDDPSSMEEISIIQRSNERVDIHLVKQDNYHVDLLSLMGQNVESHSFHNDLNIDLSEFDPGIYILVLKNNTEVIATKKVYR